VRLGNFTGSLGGREAASHFFNPLCQSVDLIGLGVPTMALVVGSLALVVLL
jgi:hypothetical protein